MANTKVSGDLIQDGAISQNHLNENHGITTTDIGEGTALYYTDARVANYLTTNNYATQTYVGTITTNSTNWDTAYSWGDHSLVGYLTTETDPVFVASPAYSITSTNITNWDTAYGWGDHSAAGYLTSFTETDPIYVASSWYTTTNNATNWDTAYSWGNHATQSYATQTYVNTAVANLVDTAPTTLDTLNELAAALGDDPNFATTVSTSIGTKWTQDNTKISNWDTAYSWGNHASAGYLTSLPSHTHDDRYYTESESDSRFWRVTPSSINVTTSNPFDNSLTETRVTGNGNYLIQYTGASAQLISSATGGSASIFQIGAHYNGSDFYMRTRIDSSNWQDWKKLWHSGNLTSTSISNWNTAYSWGNHAGAGYLTSFDITTQTDSKYLRSDTSDTMAGTLTASGLNISGKAEFQGDAAIEGGTGFGIFKGYTLNNNHFVASRCIVTGSTSSPTFTAGHDMTFVEYLNTTDRGFRFKNSSTGSYVEVAGIFTDRSEFAGSLRSPIFYDSNDTTYYLNPNSTSNLYQLQSPYLGNGTPSYIGNNGGSENWNVFHIKGGTNNHIGFGYHGSSRSIFGRDGASIHFDETDSFRLHTNGWDTEFEVEGGGEAWLKGALRTSRVYDNNNTAYYVDPASTSVLSEIADNLGNRYTSRSHSGSDFPNGTLVQTNIPATSWAGNSFVLEATGKSYSTAPPFSFMAQGYLYADTIINYSGVHFSLPAFSQMKIFEYNGNLCFWWPRWGYWNSFDVCVRNADGSSVNRVTSITDSTEPTGTKKVTVNMQQVAVYDNDWSAGRALYAGAYYDSNNTNYYVNPNGSSVLAGSLTVSNNNATGGGIILADDGDIVDLNDAYCSMRFSYGVRVFSANRGGSAVHTLHSNGTFTASGDVVAYSDARVKENIEPITNALEKTLNIKGVYYNRTDKEDKSRKVGVIAQEIIEVLPEVVTKDDQGMLGVSYGNITAVLIEAIKELSNKVEDLENKLNGTN